MMVKSLSWIVMISVMVLKVSSQSRADCKEQRHAGGSCYRFARYILEQLVFAHPPDHQFIEP